MASGANDLIETSPIMKDRDRAFRGKPPIILPQAGGSRSLSSTTTLGHFFGSRPLRLLALTSILLLIACGKGSSPPADIQAHVALAQAASCDSLQQSVQDAAVRQMRAEIDAEKNWNGYPIAMGGAAGTPQTAGAAPPSDSTTNTQVAGVDEADFVKNDGTRIFVLSGRTLYAARDRLAQ